MTWVSIEYAKLKNSVINPWGRRRELGKRSVGKMSDPSGSQESQHVPMSRPTQGPGQPQTLPTQKKISFSGSMEEQEKTEIWGTIVEGIG